MITTDKAQLNINVLTQEQYEQAKEDETLDADGLYMVDDDIHQMGVELDFDGLEKRELLWTNADVSASFPAQTINLDLSGYDEVEIVGSVSSGDTGWTYFNQRCEVGKNLNLQAYYSYLNRRIARVYTTGIEFNVGVKYTTYNTQTEDNSRMIPHKIYGIKRLQPSYNVIPQQVDYVVDNRNGKRVWKSGVIDDYGNPPVKVYTHAIPSMSYPANQATWLVNVAGASLSPPAGYKAVGVLGGSSNSGGLIINPIITNINANHVYGFVLNRTTSAITQVVSISILCIREDLI